MKSNELWKILVPIRNMFKNMRVANGNEEWTIKTRHSSLLRLASSFDNEEFIKGGRATRRLISAPISAGQKWNEGWFQMLRSLYPRILWQPCAIPKPQQWQSQLQFLHVDWVMIEWGKATSELPMAELQYWRKKEQGRELGCQFLQPRMLLPMFVVR